MGPRTELVPEVGRLLLAHKVGALGDADDLHELAAGAGRGDGVGTGAVARRGAWRPTRTWHRSWSLAAPAP